MGTKVGYNDSLIRLKYEDTLNIIGEVDELFDDLKQVEYRSKHDGTIVGIKVYYVAENLNARQKTNSNLLILEELVYLCKYFIN